MLHRVSTPHPGYDIPHEYGITTSRVRIFIGKGDKPRGEYDKHPMARTMNKQRLSRTARSSWLRR